MSEILFARYRLRIMRDIDLPPDDEDIGVEDTVQQAIAEAEENISDLLPDGYYCKIEED